MGQPLNILFITAHLPSLGVHAGGGRMFHLIKGLSEYHHISLLSYIAREEDREHIPAIAKFCRKVEVILRGHNPRAHNPLCLKPRRLLVEYLNPEMAQAVARELASQAYDLCQVEYIEGTAVLPKIVTIPLVLTHHEVHFAGLFRAASLERPSSLAWLGKILRGLTMLNYEIKTLRRFDSILTMCEEDARALLRLCPDLHAGVSPMGVDTEHFQPEERRAEPASMVYTGYYEHYPNEDAVIYFVREIFPIIQQRVPGAKFYIVGSHPSDGVRDLGRLDNVVVTGRVADLRPWLARASIFVAPIRLGRGMRGKILEAMAMKRAVVGSSVALAGFRVTDGHEALIADEPVAFAETVVRALTDASLRDRIAQGGYDLVQARYDWEVQVRAYHHLYCWLADQGRRLDPAMGRAGGRGSLPPKTVFNSALITRVNNLLLPLGLVYLTPKALWMLLKGTLRESYRAHLRRSGRRPLIWGVPLVAVDHGIVPIDQGLAASIDGSRRRVHKEGRQPSEREEEEMIARLPRQVPLLNSLQEESPDAQASAGSRETEDGSHDQANPLLLVEQKVEKVAAGPFETSGESELESLRTRATALGAKLVDLGDRATELEQAFNKLWQDHRRSEAHTRVSVDAR